MKTMEELKSSMEKFQDTHGIKGSIDDTNVLWFVAYIEAQNIHNMCTVKDIAHMLLNGLPKIDKNYVNQWLEEYEEEGYEESDWDEIFSNFYGI